MSKVERLLLKLWKLAPMRFRRKYRSRIRALVGKWSGRLGRTSESIEHPVSSSVVLPAERTHAPLTIVVPTYNVEEYLEECLASLAREEHSSTEIIIVDDGSTDASGEIAKRFADTDRRFRVITQENAGLGAARNAGLNSAKGDYIAFCDSDDYVINGGYGRLAESLERSGSEFAIGAISRLQSGRVWTPQWTQRLHSVDRLGAKLEEHPDLLWDVIACNKVFRKDFFERELGSWPEGIVYEDQELTAKAFLTARGIDTSATPIYVWRIREKGNSITQQKYRLDNVRDRIGVALRVAALMSHGTPEVRDAWWRKTFDADLEPFLEQVSRGDDHYWEVVYRGYRSLWELAPQNCLDLISPYSRLLTALVLESDRVGLDLVNTKRSESGKFMKAVGRDGDIRYLAPTEIDVTRPVVKDALRVRSRDVQPVVGLDSWTREPSGDVVLEGHAYCPGFDPTEHDYDVLVQVVADDSNVALELPVSQRRDTRIDELAADSAVSYAAGGFTVRLPHADILALEGRKYHFAVKVRLGQYTHVSRFMRRRFTESAGVFRLGALEDGRRAVYIYSKAHGLQLELSAPRVLLDEIELLPNRQVMLKFQPPKSIRPVGIVVAQPNGSNPVQTPVDNIDEGLYQGIFVLPVAPDNLGLTTVTGWSVRVLDSEGRLHYLNWRHSDTAFLDSVDESNAARVDLTAYGYLRLLVSKWRITIDEARIASNNAALVISGTTRVDGSNETRTVVPRLVLQSDAHRIHGTNYSFDHAEGRFRCEFELIESKGLDDAAGVVPGHYTVRVLDAGTSDLGKAYWPPVSAALARKVPFESRVGSGRVSVERTPNASALALRVGANFDISERPKYAQRVMAMKAFHTPARKIRNAALFESFGGRSVTDSPKALFEIAREEDPETPLYWSVRDSSVAVPKGATPVVAFSSAWYELLSTARILVNNNNFPYYFRKTEGQRYIQTWHGTPLKRIGLHVPPESLSLGYRELMKREGMEYWDVLLAQSESAAQTLSDAFGFRQGMTVEGYPRNDSLLDGRSAERAKRLRSRLGIQPGVRTILYAPTWRDNRKDSVGNYAATWHLNLAHLRSKLGQDWVVLYRGHVNVSRGQAPAASGMIDVSRYPDINDLYSLADVLVTDYSSVMFDWVLTGKPIFYLVPDIDEYEHEVRGFYYDFSTIAPGPLLVDTPSLVDRLLGVDDNYAVGANYERFRERFAGLDDGKASFRVFNKVWW